jgi:hypothetical protein
MKRFERGIRTANSLDNKTHNSICLRGPQHFSKHGGKRGAFNSVVCKEAVYFGSELHAVEKSFAFTAKASLTE